jgi:SpoIIAA-like
MYAIRIADHRHAVVEVVLEGRMSPEEVRLGQEELRRLLVTVHGRRFKILADVRRLQPVAPAVAEAFREMQEHALAAGLERAAQVVGSSVVTLQRTRISREAGTLSRTRSFTDRDEALDWLVHGDRPA